MRTKTQGRLLLIVGAVFLAVLLLLALSRWGLRRLHKAAECAMEASISNMSGEFSYSISSGLTIHKTSATTYSLCDAEGMGVVEGNLVGMYISTDGELIVVSYEPLWSGNDEFGQVAKSVGLSYAYGRIGTSGRLIDARLRPLSLVDEHALLIGDTRIDVSALDAVESYIESHPRGIQK